MRVRTFAFRCHFRFPAFPMRLRKSDTIANHGDANSVPKGSTSPPPLRGCLLPCSHRLTAAAILTAFCGNAAYVDRLPGVQRANRWVMRKWGLMLPRSHTTAGSNEYKEGGRSGKGSRRKNPAAPDPLDRISFTFVRPTRHGGLCRFWMVDSAIVFETPRRFPPAPEQYTAVQSRPQGSAPGSSCTARQTRVSRRYSPSLIRWASS